MATGVPKTQSKQSNGQHALPRPSDDVVLAYEGKRAAREILATQPVELVLLAKPLSVHTPLNDLDNRLYFGDNLNVLATLLADPKIRGRVNLIYIDPPYATQSVFQSRSQVDAYSDLLVGAHYIEFVRERLILLRELLAEDGSIYVHLDDKMAFHIKVVMDEIFGRRHFRNWITRKKCNPKNFTRKAYGNVSDYVLFYTKSDKYTWNRPFETWTLERAKKEYQYVEEGTGRRYKRVPIHAPGVRNGETGKIWRGMTPPLGKHWQYPPRVLDEMDAKGEIYWSPNGNPRRKIYLDESSGVPVQDIWLDFRDAHNQNIAITGYPTEKNHDLVARIVEASSNPGDLVLDCFAGSGTTLAVASQLKRHWIGVDNSIEAISTILRRFSHGMERMGDFVSQRQVENPAQNFENLPLFSWSESSQAAQTQARRQDQIEEFSLYSTAPGTIELENLVKHLDRQQIT